MPELALVAAERRAAQDLRQVRPDQRQASSSDQDLHADGRAAQVVLAERLRDARGAKNAGDVRVLDVHADADPAMHAKFDAAQDDQSRRGSPRRPRRCR